MVIVFSMKNHLILLFHVPSTTLIIIAVNNNNINNKNNGRYFCLLIASMLFFILHTVQPKCLITLSCHSQEYSSVTSTGVLLRYIDVDKFRLEDEKKDENLMGI